MVLGCGLATPSSFRFDRRVLVPVDLLARNPEGSC